MRIASLLPSATEIVCLLGLDDRLVGVTHECDYPEAARRKPVLTASVLEHAGVSSAAIDLHIREQVHQGSSIYRLDRDLLEQLNPDLILTQELCDVCAVSYAEVQAAVRAIFGERQVVSLEPTSLEEIFASVLLVGQLTGTEGRATEAVAELRARVGQVAERMNRATHRPRVYCMEWLDPPYTAGHWVPEMVALAGGQEQLGPLHQPSHTLAWDEIRAYQPEVLVLMPCGYNVAETLERYHAAQLPEWWDTLPAVQNGRVYAVNGSAYFNRPGPRIVDGLEILAQVLHPAVGVRELSADMALQIQ